MKDSKSPAVLDYNAKTRVATVNPDAFTASMPKGLTVEKVDSALAHVQKFTAAVASAALAIAKEKSSDVTVANFNIGSHCTGGVVIDENYQLLVTIDINKSDEMAAVIKQSNELFSGTVEPKADGHDGELAA